MTRKAKSKAKAKQRLDPRMVKAVGHPIRVQALTILNERVASPNELAKELDEKLSNVSYHVRVLEECECLELVKTEPRRGAVEHFYRATSRALLDADDWRRYPESVQRGVSATVLQNIMDDALAALQAGTLDAREDSHLSWTPMILDEEGWGELTKVGEAALKATLQVQAAAAARLSAADEAGFSASLTIMGYEAPGGKRKVGPPRTA